MSDKHYSRHLENYLVKKFKSLFSQVLRKLAKEALRMSLNNHETNEIRGAILTILIVDDPHEVSEKVIEYTLSNMKMCTCPP